MSDGIKFDDIDIDFSKLPSDRLRSILDAGAELIECHRVLGNTGDNIVGELIKEHDTFFEWDHYPAGDVYDTNSHSQFYYHAHPQELRAPEHGHFHTFLRPNGFHQTIDPAPVDDLELPEDRNDALSHLIAISMDKFGLPIHIFTTNRWVTGETWYKATDVKQMLDWFDIDHAQPSWPVNKWVTSMIRLFQPQIFELLKLRDKRVAGWAVTHPDENVYEDRNLEVTSVMKVSVDDQIAAAQEALDGRSEAAAAE